MWLVGCTSGLVLSQTRAKTVITNALVKFFSVGRRYHITTMNLSWDDFIAGYVGGVAGLLVGHPMDTIKLRYQVMKDGVLKTTIHTYKREGIHGFYKGMLFPLVSTGPLNALFFGVYGTCLRYLRHNDGMERIDMSNPSAMMDSFNAGCIGGLAIMMANCPVEVVKSVLQANTKGKESNESWTQYHKNYRGMWPAMKRIYKNEGLLAFYKGGLPMFIRDVPTYGLYTVVYEYLLRSYWFNDMHLIWKRSIAGGIAGVASWVLVIPFDVVKSRMQCDDPKNPKYRGMTDCFVKSYRAEGLQVFTKGFWIITIRAFPVNAAVFIFYELTLDIMRNYRNNR